MIRSPLRGLSILCVFGLMVIAVGAWAASAPEQAEQSFFYKTPDGIRFEVTTDGLTSIHQGEREIAHGSWSPFNAEGWFKDSGSGLVKTGKVTEKSLARIDDHHARVRQVKGDVVCTTDYTFEGEDVTLSARVENNHPEAPLNVTGFSGLSFHFDRPPTGLMLVQHITYFQAHGVELCHPGYWSPVGGSYAVDDHVGIGVSPWNTGLMRTLILWDYADWNQDKREKLPQRNLIYFTVSTVPPRGAATFDMKLRVSANRDWHHLLEPYRTHFQRTYGPVQYHADDRWIATDYLNRSPDAIKPNNPYGFHDGLRRLDLPEGVKAFCDTYIPALQKENGQGMIVWGQGGEEARGAMYRPDFDVLPPEVEANWATLKQRFQEAGLKLGVATRPRDMAVRLDWKKEKTEMLLQGRKALIVGGGNGLGRAIAQAYQREGATLAIADLDHDAATATLALVAQSATGLALQIDIADAAACRQLVETVAERFGRLDILVNCAALCLVDSLLDVTPERWDQVFAVNARGAFFLLQSAGRVMMPQKFGRILTISTPASRMGFPLFASYGASKAVVDSVTKAAALALAPHGVTVNTLVPGRMTSGMIDRLEQDLAKVTGKSAEELATDRTKGLPMERRVAPEEVAEAAVWLTTDAAAYVTGERFNFTGGMELS